MNELIGQQIGNYQLSRQLGQDGIVETYLGEHKYLSTIAVVKLLSIQLTEQQAALFQSKAQLLAELMHKHLVRLLDFDVQQGRPFLLQDYYPGGTLRKVHLYGSRVVLRQALGYVKRLANALDYLHSRQIVHGDVRPENVVLGWESNILLSDIGLVDLIHTLAPDSPYPPVEAFAYLAPERLQGQLLPAGDQYALAVMVYEWLCGETPFHGSLTETITGHQTMQPPALLAKSPDLPEPVEQVIMTALAKDPAERFANIQAFATAFEQAIGNAGTVVAIASSPAASSPTPVNATPVTPPAATPTLPTAPMSEPSVVPPASVSALPTTPMPQHRTAPVQLSRRAMVAALAVGGVGLAAASWLGVTALLRGSSTRSTSTPVMPSPGTQLIGKVSKTYNGAAYSESIIWSPSGKRLVTASHDEGLEVWDTITGQRIAKSPYNIDIFQDANPFHRFVWIGDRFYVAVINTSDQQHPTIQVTDLVSNKEIFTYEWYAQQQHGFGPPEAPDNLDWSPDGQMIASIGFETGTRVWRASTGEDISQFQAKPNHDGLTNEDLKDFHLAWAPDSKHIATWGSGFVHVWDSSNGQLICSYSKHWDQHKNDQNPPALLFVAWSPDSTRIASCIMTDSVNHVVDGVVHVWDASNGNEIFAYNGTGDTIGMYWSGDSKLLACTTDKAAIVVLNANNGIVLTTHYEETKDIFMVWHPHRYYIATPIQSVTDQNQSDSRGSIWDATTGKEIVRLSYRTEQGLAWSPDGLQLAVSVSSDASEGLTYAVQIWQVWR